MVVTAGVAGLLGWALLAVLTRTTRRPVTIWRVAAVVALLLSLGGPLSAGAGAAAAVLVALHVAVAAVLVPLAYVLYTGHIWEDYFITFRCSRNLVEGIINPAEAPVYAKQPRKPGCLLLHRLWGMLPKSCPAGDLQSRPA